MSDLVYALTATTGDLAFGAPRDVALKGFTERCTLRAVTGTA